VATGVGSAKIGFLLVVRWVARLSCAIQVPGTNPVGGVRSYGERPALGTRVTFRIANRRGLA
jgi:hypothetical protein